MSKATTNNNNILERIESKLDAHGARIAEINITLAQQHSSLEEHMRRTMQNETALEKHFVADQAMFDALHNDFEPIKKAHMMWAGAGKVLATCATLGTLLGGLLKFLNLI